MDINSVQQNHVFLVISGIDNDNVILCISCTVIKFNKVDVYNRFPLEVAVPYKTALSHSILTGLLINVCIYLCIFERNDFIV